MMDQTTAEAVQERAFHFFSRLPAELRWKIWEYSLPGPRLVSIRCGSDDLGCPSYSSSVVISPPTVGDPGRARFWTSPSSSPSSAGCTSPARIPANLHTSHEARREALRHYHAAFGIAHRQGQIFFSAPSDILYFGPRDGFMASEAQLRTVLMLCDPTELAHVQKVAINDAVFWAPAAGSTKVAVSLLVGVLSLLRKCMLGLRELVFVPRDKHNPLYSGDACLVEPAMAHSRLASIVKEAMAISFGDQLPSDRSWKWRIMALSTNAVAPVQKRQMLGWHGTAAADEEPEDVGYGTVQGHGHLGAGWTGEKQWTGKSKELSRLNLLQQSLRREFMYMEVGAQAVPVVVE